VRPSPEALGVDLFGVAEAVGYDLQILEDTARTMTRLAFLLVG
jgi:predicted metal-binding protein